MSDISELANSTGGSSRNSCGELSVVNLGGLKEIRFQQVAEDVFTARQPGLKLRDVQFRPFESGMSRALHTCTFDPPLTSESTGPWTAECTTEREGRDGQVDRVTYLVTIDEFTTDHDRIGGEINEVLALVPDGEMVVTDEPVQYVLRDGQIERKVDQDAIEFADGLAFHNPTWPRRFLVIAAVVLITVFIVMLVRHRVRNDG